MKSKISIIFLLTLSSLLFSCRPKKRGNLTGAIPGFNLVCEYATDCKNATPGFIKTSLVYWLEGATCDNSSGASIVLKGAGTTKDNSTAGQILGEVSSYENGEVLIPYGDYTVWIGIDTSGNSKLDAGEPIVCENITINSPSLGTIAIDNNSGSGVLSWHNATNSDLANIQ